MSNAPRKTFYTMIYKAILSGLGFINSALVARLLNPTDRAEFQYSGSWAQIGMTYFGGYTNYSAIALPKYPDETRQIIQLGNLVVMVASLATWLIGFLLTWGPLPILHVSRPWQWALFIMPLMYIFGYGSRILQSTDKITWLNRANAAQPFLFTLILIPIFLNRHHISSHFGLTLTYVSWVASFAVAAIGTMIVAYRLLKLRGVTRLRFTRAHWKGTWSYGGWSSIAQVVNVLNYRMDFLLVYNLLPPYDASLYGIAVVASEVLLNISGSISSVVYRRMTGNDRTDAIFITELSTRHTIVSSTIVAIGMCIVFPWLITAAYTKLYSGSILPFFILLPGLIIKAASNMVIQYATNSLGNAKTSIWMNGISAVFNALCCVVFIPLFGLIGAAIASTASYALSYAVYVIWFARINHVSPAGLLVIRKSDLVPYVEIVKNVLRRLHMR